MELVQSLPSPLWLWSTLSCLVSITSVVYEKYHYYAYRVLRERGFPAYLPHYRRKVNRLLFRLVNYFRPKSLIEVGIGNGIDTIYAGCVSYYGLRHLERQGLGKDFRQWRKLAEVHTLDCLHIGHTPFYKEVFELVLPYAGPRSCFIVGGIHESKEKRKWWEQIVASESTGITFDLYDIGLVFFYKAT